LFGSSPEALQRKTFEMDLKMDSLLEGKKNIKLTIYLWNHITNCNYFIVIGMKTLLNVRKIACVEPEADDIVRHSKFKLPLNNIVELERLDKSL
jgi:hypothetical protein